jgi:hypothetical protein
MVARALAIRASAPRRDVTVAANETGGYKYIPGGREFRDFLSGISADHALVHRPFCFLIITLDRPFAYQCHCVARFNLQPFSRVPSMMPHRLTLDPKLTDHTTGLLNESFLPL